MQSSSKSKSADNSTRPVSIKQILEAAISPQEITIPIDGIATNEITMVGCISNVKSAETSKLFFVEDGTGTIDAKMWNPSEEFSTYREGIWVRIFGVIKPYNNNVQITINKMRQIVEFNEITYHNLAVIEAHLMLTRGTQGLGKVEGNAKGMAGNALTNQANNYVMQGNQPNNSFGNGEFSSPPYNAYGNGGAVGGDIMGQMIAQFNQIQKDVFFFYKQYNNTPNGANINDVIKNFRVKYDHKEIIKTSQYLVDEGYIYLTCDDNHAKCAAF